MCYNICYCFYVWFWLPARNILKLFLDIYVKAQLSPSFRSQVLTIHLISSSPSHLPPKEILTLPWLPFCNILSYHQSFLRIFNMVSTHTSGSQQSATLGDNKWVTKALMRLSATVIGLIAMCLFSAAISYENSNYQNIIGNGDWTDGLALAPVCFDILIIFLVLHTNDTRLSSPFSTILWHLSCT